MKSRKWRAGARKTKKRGLLCNPPWGRESRAWTVTKRIALAMGREEGGR